MLASLTWAWAWDFSRLQTQLLFSLIPQRAASFMQSMLPYGLDEGLLPSQNCPVPFTPAIPFGRNCCLRPPHAIHRPWL
eukprot:3279140-Pleurochrysis_carterae.AAC.1